MKAGKYIYIRIDTNDGDYVANLNPITDEEIELIKPVIEAIKNFKLYAVPITYCQGNNEYTIEWKHNSNYPIGECLRTDLGEKSPDELYGHLEGYELFDSLTPYSEYGFHTIEEIKIVIILEELL